MLTSKKIGEKIRKLREDLGISQAELAKKLNFSRVTVTQLELGRRGLEAIELVKIAKIFNINPSYLLQEEEPAAIKERGDFANKKIKFNKDKLRNTILYLLEKCGGKPNIGETVIYKLLYFIDFDSYEIFEKPVTGMNYVKFKYGPIPHSKEYNSVVSEMINKNELKIITQEYHGMMQKRYIALVDADKDNLSEEEKNIINTVIAKYSDFNAKTIENFVHGDTPWKETKDREIINYNLVYNRIPPYANRDYEIEFMQAGASDINNSLPPLLKEEYDYYENL